MHIEEKDFVQYLTIKKRLAPKSIKTYRIRFNVLKKWLIEKICDLDKKSVEEFLFQLKERKLSNAGINTYIQALKHIEGCYKDRGLLTGFMEGVEGLPKTQSEIVILSIEELNRLTQTHLEYKNRNGVLCNDLDRKYLTLTNFLAISGCRFEEAASLKVKRLDISNGKATLVETKNKKNRYVYFDGPIKDDLLYLISGKGSENLVFTNSKNGHIHPGDFNNDLRLRAKTAGITKRVHAHLLRHSFATHLLESGVDIAKVSTLLGHKDIQTTYETYVHLADDSLQKASLRNPLTRKFSDPKETMQTVKEAFESFRLGNDDRFECSVVQNSEVLQITLRVK